MSQRECSGFNWPGDRGAAGGLSTEDPLASPPESVSCACRDNEVSASPIGMPRALTLAFLARNCAGVPPASCAAGVAHEDSLATSFNGLALSPCLLLALDFQSRAVAVGHVARNTVSRRFERLPSMCRSLPPPAAPLARGVGHAAILAAPVNFRHGCDGSPFLLLCVEALEPSVARGVGHEPQSLSLVRCADARSAQIRRPDGVTASFQVSENKVEPLEAKPARNLLSKEDWRATLADECEPCWPKMSRVECSEPLARVREPLAWAGAGPDVGIIGDSGESEGMRPPADPGEKMALSNPGNVAWGKLGDGPLVDASRGDVAMSLEFLQPRRSEWGTLVVEGGGRRHVGSMGLGLQAAIWSR
jgi:hypothetical protein